MEDCRQLPYPVDFYIKDEENSVAFTSLNNNEEQIHIPDEVFTPDLCAKRIMAKNWIANGTYANIYRYSKNYSLKVYNPSMCKMLDTSIELYALTQLNHPCILKCKYVTSKKESIVLLMPHYEYSLAELLPSTLEERESVMKQLVSGLQYLHSRKILHLDLSPRNILVKIENDHLRAVICDFSLSCVCIGDSFSSRTSRITSDYRPYENLSGLKKYSRVSDIWSLGVIFYRIETENYLFSFATVPRHKHTYADCDLAVKFEIEKRQLWGEWPPKCDERIQRMLDLDPETRIRSTDLCSQFDVDVIPDVIFQENESSILPNWKYLSKFYKKVDRFTIPQVDHLFKSVKEFFNSKSIILTPTEENKIFISCYGIVKSCTTELSAVVNKTSLESFSDIFSIFCAVKGEILTIKNDRESSVAS